MKAGKWGRDKKRAVSKKQIRLVSGLLCVLFLAGGHGMQAEAEAAAPVRVSRVETTVSSVEEAKAVVSNAIQTHTDYIRLEGGGSAYGALGSLVTQELYAPLHSYEGATLCGIQVAQKGDLCVVQLKRVSTVEEENAVDAIVAQYIPLLQGMSTQEQIIAVHDFICNQVTYSDETALGNADFSSAYDGLASGQGVCTTYALLFQKFMDQLGIPCYVATGNVRGTGHAWNVVNVDGSWYHVDCTWDDQSYGIIYNWCLAGADRAGYASWGGVVLAETSLD